MAIFTDISLVPIDENIPEDTGDFNSRKINLHEVGIPESELKPMRTPLNVSRTNHFVIPFTRVIKFGSNGKDVLGAKRALSRAGFLKWVTPFTPVFGPIASEALKKFQKDMKLRIDGQLGSLTLLKLAPYFDDYAFLLYVGYPPTSNKEEQIRNKIVAYCWWAYNNRNLFHYLERRPMQFLNDLKHLPVWKDCSEFATDAYKCGGGPDPNGENPPFNGLGWTGTMGKHGKLLADISQAKPADLPLYGARPNFGHVAVYVGGGKVISHGSEGGPYFIPADYRPIVEIRDYISK